jgi:uncharacterized repeat protein (TIGR03847 family)
VDIELDPVDRITADAVGPAGERTFFIQARKDDRVVTVLVEKQQVQLLAASILEILARVEEPTGEGDPAAAMALEEPVVPEWRAGRLSIGYQEERDLVLLEVEELVPDPEDADSAAGTELQDEVREPGSVRFWATREQMLAMARHGAAVCAAGRPLCQFCENPIDPEGHVCPAMNGHRDLAE